MQDEVKEQAQQEEQQQAESTPPSETEKPAAPAAAEPSETPSQEQQEQEHEQQPSRKGGVQRRIDELTRKAHLATAEAEYWKTKAIGEKPEASKPAAEPNPADFETTGEYFKAVRTWDREQLEAKFEAKLQDFGKKQQERSEAERLQDEWTEKEGAAQKAHADYGEVTASALDAIGTNKSPAVQAIAHAIQYSEAGPELLYHFGQHPEELGELATLHPTQAVIALGRLEVRLTPNEPGEKAAPQHTRAPKPPTPIRTTSVSGKPKPDDPASDKAMTDQEWLRARDQQVRERASR